MTDRLPLLTTRQMADFVADGFLRFDAIVPDGINRAALEEMRARGDAGCYLQGQGVEPLAAVLDGTAASVSVHGDQPLAMDRSSGFGAMLRLPAVRGIIASLVGAEPRFDHYALHVIKPGWVEGHFWHADAAIDPRPAAFDIQLMYFPQDTPRELGGTMLLPGSHFRRVHEAHIARYQNFVGQRATVCPAGTVIALHHGMWHVGQPNRSDRARTMFKLRLNPGVQQLRLWDTADLDHPEIRSILSRDHGWYGREHRLEVIQRIRLWRHLIGDARWDFDLWLTRVENEPTAVANAALATLAAAG